MPVEWVVGGMSTIIGSLVAAIVFLFFQNQRRNDDQVVRMQRMQDDFLEAISDAVTQTATSVAAILEQGHKTHDTSAQMAALCTLIAEQSKAVAAWVTEQQTLERRERKAP